MDLERFVSLPSSFSLPGHHGASASPSPPPSARPFCRCFPWSPRARIEILTGSLSEPLLLEAAEGQVLCLRDENAVKAIYKIENRHTALRPLHASLDVQHTPHPLGDVCSALPEAASCQASFLASCSSKQLYPPDRWCQKGRRCPSTPVSASVQSVT